MESLALPSLNAFPVSTSSFHREQSTKLLGKARYFNSLKPSSLKLTPSISTHPFVWLSSIFQFWLMSFLTFFLLSFLFLVLFIALSCLGAKKTKENWDGLFFALLRIQAVFECKLVRKITNWSKWETWLLQRRDGMLWYFTLFHVIALIFLPSWC